MKNLFNQFKYTLASIGLVLISSAQAAPVAIVDAPLVNSGSLTVLPNLMFIIDNSGSMSQDYTPDYLSDKFGTPAGGDRNCRDSADDDFTVNGGVALGATRVLDMCVVGDPPFMSSDMNFQYYNPAISYKPGSQANGVALPSQTNPANVLVDGYKIERQNQLQDVVAQTTPSGLTTDRYFNLNNYPDRVWCTTQTPSATDLTNAAVCRKNTDYLYPDATFKHGRSTGSPNQQADEGMLNGVLGVSSAPYYYRVVPTEYCTDNYLTKCTLSSVPVVIGADNYNVAAKSRWCSDVALTTCQALKTNTFTYPRYVGGATTTGTAAVGSFRVETANSGTTTLAGITVNSVQIMGGAGVGCGTASSTPASGANNNARRNGLANAIVTRINSCVSNPEYTASSDGAGRPTITITSTTAAGATANGTLTWSTPTNSANFDTKVNVAGGVNSTVGLAPYTFVRVDINNVGGTYTGSNDRTDCLAKPTCTYTEELTNFANWYTYYRTRMQTMKSSASQAFASIDNKFKVGFITINQLQYLPVAKFDSGTATSQKEKWFTRLYASDPGSGGGTPLRSGLATVGRIFAGKNPVPGFTADPMEYSCQQNYALLTTDGYWNGDTNAGDVKKIDGSAMTNADSAVLPKEKYEGPTASQDSLADVARYYADTDIRNSANFSNCTGAISGVNVCQDTNTISGTINYEKQGMTTFTLGLGVDGTIGYSDTYATDTTGDFARLKNPNDTLYWPVPAANTERAVDDLWHAAVNGNGTYFSARDPQTLTKSLVAALKSIGATTGAGAAAATSTLNPVAGNNTAYVASYVSKKWTGNLEGREINTTTGAVSETASWCVEDVVNDAGCASPKFVDDFTDGAGKTTYYCVEPNAADDTAEKAACLASESGNGIVDGTSCKIKLQDTCQGALKKQTTRDIKIAKYATASGALANFEHANLNAVQQAYFASSSLATSLSQWTSLDATQQDLADNQNVLINYLRGNTTYDDRTSNPSANRLFRKRDKLLGDIIESAPKFLGKSNARYTDIGFGPSSLAGTFSASTLTRPSTVYFGANDGMLHAINAVEGSADIGKERWAFIPSAVLKNLPKLADRNYDSNHLNYVNGDVVIADVCKASNCTAASTSAGDWATILVGGLNGGGKGYYALDITDPTNPILLWEFGTSKDYATDLSFDPHMGLSFGNPIITKKSNGQWVVLFTSGYNNTTTASDVDSGKGFLYVVDAYTGQKLSKIATGEGSHSDPSGLSKITAYVDDVEVNNTAGKVYGGDLKGNLWRFDINAEDKFLFAQLTDANGASQPITSAPELGLVKNNIMVFVGTGKFLEVADLSSTQKQTFYAIAESTTNAVVSNYRSTGGALVNRNAASGRGVNSTLANLVTDRGWFYDFPDNGERENIKPRLVLGALLIPSLVPSDAACTPGGYGYLNILDFGTGGQVGSNPISQPQAAPIVGINVVFIKGLPVVSVTLANNPTPKVVPFTALTATSGFQGKRIIWRELTD
jgi:type IV pilus assembly protein PilY1